MRRFMIIVLCCFIVFVLSSLLFGARETVYVIAKMYVGCGVLLLIILVVGHILLRGKRNDVE